MMIDLRCGDCLEIMKDIPDKNEHKNHLLGGKLDRYQLIIRNVGETKEVKKMSREILLIISLCLTFGGGFGAIILMIIDMNREDK